MSPAGLPRAAESPRDGTGRRAAARVEIKPFAQVELRRHFDYRSPSALRAVPSRRGRIASKLRKARKTLSGSGSPLFEVFARANGKLFEREGKAERVQHFDGGGRYVDADAIAGRTAILRLFMI